MTISEVDFANRVNLLQQYFAEKLAGEDLTIAAMNDDRGFNVKKNLSTCLVDTLMCDKYSIEFLDMFFMFFNKTWHIDYFLSHNLTMEEIRLMREYGTTNELNHAIGFNVPFMSFVSKILNRMMLSKVPLSSDPKLTRISSEMEKALFLIVIYASGLNDIMYRLHINMFNLEQAYMDRNISPKYQYSCDMANERTIQQIIEGHEKNFEKILGLNDGADIYALSAYFYSDMTKDYEQKFKEAILMYNEGLENLCKEYGVTYIDCRILEKTKYNKPLSNYLSEHPPRIIADEIINKMYDKYLGEKSTIVIPKVTKFTYDNTGLLGVIKDLESDVSRQTKEANKWKIRLDAINTPDLTEKEFYTLMNYFMNVALEKVEEHQREKGVTEQSYRAYQKFMKKRY